MTSPHCASFDMNRKKKKQKKRQLAEVTMAGLGRAAAVFMCGASEYAHATMCMLRNKQIFIILLLLLLS